MIEQIKSIAREKGQTLEQAATEIGVSRFQLRKVARGESLGSKSFWEGMIRWSGGRVTPDESFRASIESAKSGEAA